MASENYEDAVHDQAAKELSIDIIALIRAEAERSKGDPATEKTIMKALYAAAISANRDIDSRFFSTFSATMVAHIRDVDPEGCTYPLDANIRSVANLMLAGIGSIPMDSAFRETLTDVRSALCHAMAGACSKHDDNPRLPDALVVALALTILRSAHITGLDRIRASVDTLQRVTAPNGGPENEAARTGVRAQTDAETN